MSIRAKYAAMWDKVKQFVITSENRLKQRNIAADQSDRITAELNRKLAETRSGAVSDTSDYCTAVMGLTKSVIGKTKPLVGLKKERMRKVTEFVDNMRYENEKMVQKLKSQQVQRLIPVTGSDVAADSGSSGMQSVASELDLTKYDPDEAFVILIRSL